MRSEGRHVNFHSTVMLLGKTGHMYVVTPYYLAESILKIKGIGSYFFVFYLNFR